MKYYIETYGCQMNVADSEIISALLKSHNYTYTPNIDEANIILINTCSIREKAESTLFNKLDSLKQYKNMIIGVLGCMAQRLGQKIIDKCQHVNFVIGPDKYRSLIMCIENALKGQINVQNILSTTETYHDILPDRINSNGISAFIPIMRGCNNMCSYCVVPFTRGRERSRQLDSIIREAHCAVEQGYKEITLLGQNVDSYLYENITFAQLLEQIANIDSTVRIRFTTSHPKDLTTELISTMKKYDNICKHIHLPVQSGSNKILKRMNRTYTREEYIDKVNEIRCELGNDCGLTTDIMVGFCGETNEDFNETLSLMETIKFDSSFTFAYSQREGTISARTMADDVDHNTKIERLNEVINLQKQHSLERNQLEINKKRIILVESPSKRSDLQWQGRTSQYKTVVFPYKNTISTKQYIIVKITNCTSATLLGVILDK